MDEVRKFVCVFIFALMHKPNSLVSFSPVFVLNHASPDDFQPLSLREMHTELAANFQGAKVNIAGKCACNFRQRSSCVYAINGNRIHTPLEC